MSDNFSQVIHSTFWQEEAEPGNPFVAARSRWQPPWRVHRASRWNARRAASSSA